MDRGVAKAKEFEHVPTIDKRNENRFHNKPTNPPPRKPNEPRKPSDDFSVEDAMEIQQIAERLFPREDQ